MRRFFLLVVPVLCALLPLAEAGDKKLDLKLRQRIAVVDATAPEKPAVYKTILKAKNWEPKQTAVIVCDMWDTHHCYNAVQRVVEIAPRMNEVLEKSRSLGVLIIH